MGRWSLLVLALLGAGCSRKAEPPPPPPPPAKPAAWPADLVEGVRELSVRRWRGEEPPREAHVLLGEDGTWRMDRPRRGEADPEAIGNLLFALRAPAVRAAAAGASLGKPAFIIDLVGAKATRRVVLGQAPLGADIPVEVEGVGRFVAAPSELGTKLPDPADLLPPALWTSAGQGLDSIEVQRGKVKYRLTRGEDGKWTAGSGKPSALDLDDFAGAFTGRQVLDHPEPGPAEALGLAPPAFTATACVHADCRTFEFGRVEREGHPRYFARAPDMAPVEVRAEIWELLAAGPFPPRR